jgi:peptidoglycan/LPS O-acetylase OafA/YrhL
MRSAPEGARIPALTGVRAVAAFLVFFHHHPAKVLQVGPLLLWLELHVGVTLFFVLSGFMITWRYDRGRPEPQSFLRGYFVNRFARIYPLYLALAVPTMLLGGARSVHAWLLNLTVFTSFESGIPQAWSLRVEECFYIGAPLIYAAWRRHPAIPLAVGAAVLGALYPVSRLPVSEGILGPPYYLFLYTFFGRFFEFYVGIWLAKEVAASSRAPNPAGRFPLFTLVGAVGIAAVVVCLAAIYSASGRPAYLFGVQHPAGIALNNLILPLFVAALYWGLVRERSVIRWILSTRIADLLGRSSYAFYLVHMGLVLDYLLGRILVAAGWLGPRAAASAAMLIGNVGVLFIFVTLLSIALYEGIEAPANRYLRRRLAPARPGDAGNLCPPASYSLEGR